MRKGSNGGTRIWASVILGLWENSTHLHPKCCNIANLRSKLQPLNFKVPVRVTGRGGEGGKKPGDTGGENATISNLVNHFF